MQIDTQVVWGCEPKQVNILHRVVWYSDKLVNLLLCGGHWTVTFQKFLLSSFVFNSLSRTAQLTTALNVRSELDFDMDCQPQNAIFMYLGSTSTLN